MPIQTLSKLVQVVSDFVDEYIAGGNKRAASVGDIWSFLQNQLDEEAMADPDYVAPIETEDGGYIPGSPRSYIIDIYQNAQGMFALITKSDGKLYKVPISVGKDNSIVTGEYIESFMEALPVTGRQVSVVRSADGKVRWFAMPACTAVLNRSGEIDSRALFDSFVDHVMRTGDYPLLDFYHKGERLILGRADNVQRIGYSYCATGTFEDTPFGRAAAESLEREKDYWGLSIAYLPTSNPSTISTTTGEEIPVYNAGINRFISLLPENAAASILTSISTEEKKRMNEREEEALAVMTGGRDTPLFKQAKMKLDGIDRSAPGMISRKKTVERAIAPEDLTAILESDEFLAKVTAIIMQHDADEAQEELDETTAEITAMQENQKKENSNLRALISGLTAKVSIIEKARAAEIQETQDDMPATPLNRQSIVRVRTSAPITDPKAARIAQASEAANAALERMNAKRQTA